MGIFLEVTNTYRKFFYKFHKNKLNENIRVQKNKIGNGKKWKIGV